MKRIITTGTFVFLFNVILAAQAKPVPGNSGTANGIAVQTIDSTSLWSAFKRGHANTQFRYFFMNTRNTKGLTDYFANALGAGTRYETAPFHGLQLGGGVFFTLNMGSSDLTKADPASGQFNRYEVALFNVDDATHKKYMGRIEELYLKYNYKNSAATFGRQFINTPFINLQDGRMRPTGIEGLWVRFNEIKKTNIEGGLIWSVSPRGSSRWYNAGNSIGVYPGGVNPDGTKALYAGNIKSSALAVLGITTSLSKKIKLHAWDMFAANVFNTAMLQTDLDFAEKNSSSFFISAQATRQDAVNNGGNEDPSKTFFLKGSHSFSFGAKAGWKNASWETSLNYNRITKSGRFLVPREWGREPFFTFLPRERNDGFGDVHAIVGKLNYNMPGGRLKTSLAAGYVHLPDVKDFFLNKYGLPSYVQLNMDIRYNFAKALKGLDAECLLVSKVNRGETYNNPKYIINKVDMLQFNFVLNYHL